VEPNVPVNAPLESQIGYCASHQLRVHTRWGSFPVDRRGREVCHPEDIVDGIAVRLGTGWHVRESAGPGRPFRGASDLATLVADPLAAGLSRDVVLHLDFESNPYHPGSAVDVAIDIGGSLARTVTVTGRMRVTIPLETGSLTAPQEIRLRAQPPT